MNAIRLAYRQDYESKDTYDTVYIDVPHCLSHRYQAENEFGPLYYSACTQLCTMKLKIQHSTIQTVHVYSVFHIICSTLYFRGLIARREKQDLRGLRRQSLQRLILLAWLGFCCSLPSPEFCSD